LRLVQADNGTRGLDSRLGTGRIVRQPARDQHGGHDDSGAAVAERAVNVDRGRSARERPNQIVKGARVWRRGGIQRVGSERYAALSRTVRRTVRRAAANSLVRSATKTSAGGSSCAPTGRRPSHKPGAISVRLGS
jgi:hypothetical protein